MLLFVGGNAWCAVLAVLLRLLLLGRTRTTQGPVTPDLLCRTPEEKGNDPESVLWNDPVGLLRREEVAGAQGSGEKLRD